MCCRFTQADGELRTQEPEAEGGVSEEDSGVSHGLLRPDGLPDRYHHREPVQAHLSLRGAHGRLFALQKGTHDSHARPGYVDSRAYATTSVLT